MSQTLPGNTLSTENLRTKTEKSLGHLPCKWQVTVVEAILKKDKDVILIAAMGSGKTLTFWTVVPANWVNPKTAIAANGGCNFASNCWGPWVNPFYSSCC
jgi:hypothetical protein